MSTILWICYKKYFQPCLLNNPDESISNKKSLRIFEGPKIIGNNTLIRSTGLMLFKLPPLSTILYTNFAWFFLLSGISYVMIYTFTLIRSTRLMLLKSPPHTILYKNFTRFFLLSVYHM